MIIRESIDIGGNIGSLYNAYEDRLVGQLNLINVKKINQSKKQIRCEIKRVNNLNDTLLKYVSLNEQLKLSLLLKLIDCQGISNLIDYPYSITKNTRLFCYQYINRIEKLSENVSIDEISLNATHLINSIEYGIDLIIVFELPSDQNQGENLDKLLNKLVICFYSNYNSPTIICDEKDLVDQILHLKVYSNIPQLLNLTKLNDICDFIEQNKYSLSNYPVLYQLRSIKSFNSKYPRIFVSFSDQLTVQINQYLFELISNLNQLERFLNENLIELLNKDQKELLISIENQWINIKNQSIEQIKQISQLIQKIRSGKIQPLNINQILNNQNYFRLKNSIETLKELFEDLKEKLSFRNQLNQLNIKFIQLNNQHQINTIEQILIKDTKNDRIICSNSNLRKIFKDQLLNLFGLLVEQRKINPNISLIYVDFSDTNIPLSQIIVLPFKIFVQQNHFFKEKSVSKSKNEQNSSSIEQNTINILFIGQTAVGKSTLINSFINFIKYQTLDQAKSGKGLSIIPISFVMTTNHNFDKERIKSVSLLNTINEDFDHPDQRITQHCKSYVFCFNGKRYRLIDTPGFADKRGIGEDNQTLKEIFEYLYQYDHLNAICFLFKSNEYYLHRYFGETIKELRSYFGSNIEKNFLFCFTNSRSTFYSSSNIHLLIENCFKENEIQFESDRNFYFDNESFIYLIALQNQIKYNDHEIEDFNISWSISINQFDHLMDFISNNLSICDIKQNIPTIVHLRFQLIDLIKPILETIRNILRNFILWNMDSPYKSIQLICQIPKYLTNICQLCQLNPIQSGNFWIPNPKFHLIKQNQCLNCQCSINEHIQLDYILQYQYSNNSPIYSRNQIKSLLDQLAFIAPQFSKYLCLSNDDDDPFLIGLNQMIKQEQYISNNYQPNYLNLQLIEDLNKFLNKYQLNKKNIQTNEENIEQIFNLIDQIKQYPTIRMQIDALKQGKKINQKQDEYQIDQF